MKRKRLAIVIFSFSIDYRITSFYISDIRRVLFYDQMQENVRKDFVITDILFFRLTLGKKENRKKE